MPPPTQENADKPRLSPLAFVKKAWAGLGFTRLTVTMMIKGSLSPTIATAMYQSHSVADNYLNLGYLIIVMSLLTVPILPRGKFLQNFFISLVSLPSTDRVSLIASIGNLLSSPS